MRCFLSLVMDNVQNLTDNASLSINLFFFFLYTHAYTYLLI